MPKPFEDLRAGDISKTSPVADKAQALARFMCLEAARLQLPATDALGAVAGFVGWIVSHFKTPEDRAAAIHALVKTLEANASGPGAVVVPLSDLVVDKNSPDFIPLQKRPN